MLSSGIADAQVWLPPPIPSPPTFDSRPFGPAPVILTPAVGAFSVVLQWQVPDCAISYEVERSDGMVWRSDETAPGGACPDPTLTIRAGMPVPTIQGLPPQIYTYADNVRAASAYHYIVRANYKDMRSSSSPSFPVATPPAPNPTNFSATHDGAGNATLRWDPIPTASGYVLSGGGLPSPMHVSRTTTVFPVTPGPHVWSLVATHATWYDGAVANTAAPSRAGVMVVGPQPWFSPTTAMDQTLCHPPRTLPGPAPRHAAAHSGGLVGGVWWGVVPEAIAYVVERYGGGGTTWTFAGSTCGGPSRFKVYDDQGITSPDPFGYVEFTDYSGGIAPETAYRYRVKAIGMAGETGSYETTWWTSGKPSMPLETYPQANFTGGSGPYKATLAGNGEYTFPSLPTDWLDLHLQWTNDSPWPTQYRITDQSGWTHTQPAIRGLESLRLYGIKKGTYTYTITAEWVDAEIQPPLVVASTSRTIKITIPP